MEEKIIYMAYGSNLNLNQMSRLCRNAHIIAKSTLEDYLLLFRGEDGNAFLNIEEKKGSKVPVLVWEISQEDEKSLDVFEEYPVVYHKEYKEVDVEGQRIKAMAYVMNDGFPLGRPSDTYYNTIRDGYKTAHYDIKILEEAMKASTNHH